LQTDNWGSETTWTLVNNGETVASGGPYGDNQSYEEEYCIDAGCYVFDIFDSWGDGICCGYGEGNYEIIVDGESIYVGDGQFGSSERTEFCSDDYEAPPCDGGEFELQLLTDSYGSETTWTLTTQPGGDVIADGGPYGNNLLYEVERCLSPGCYMFTIYDSWGDGICCGWGEGDYQLILDGDVIMDSDGQFDYDESTEFCVEEEESCTDSGVDIYYNGNSISCALVASYDKCDVVPAASHCPETCDMCDMYGCEDSQAPFRIQSYDLTCTDIPISACSYDIIATTCREKCNYC